MKKIIVASMVAMLALSAFGCNKDKKESNTAASAAAAPAAAEALKSIRAESWRVENSANPDNHICTLVVVTKDGDSYKISKASAKASGKCDFSTLNPQAAGELALSSVDQFVQLGSRSDLSQSAKSKLGCTAINVKTTQNAYGVQHCPDAPGKNHDVASALAKLLSL